MLTWVHGHIKIHKIVLMGKIVSDKRPVKPQTFKVLVVSDVISPMVYDNGIRTRFGDIDLALSCGDLPYYYLEYIVSMLNVPLLYVHGNHDRPLQTEHGEIPEPRGCISVEGRVVRVNGLLIGGLGGSIRYKPSGIYQYTEHEMRGRIARMAFTLWRNRILHGRALDIFIAHSPPRGIHDQEDLPHHGFAVFRTFVRRYQPRYFIHGHSYPRMGVPQRSREGNTEVIHVYGHKVVEVTVGNA